MITSRPAVLEDFDFLYALHRATMRGYAEEAFGPWDEEWQQAYYRRSYPIQNLRVVQLDGQDAGMLYVQERTEELYLASIEILPAFQRRGIGTAVIRELIAAAARLGKPVALQVLKGNIRARSLYQRLGFGVTGENDTHYILAYEHPEKE
jgi:ribosomal protein S18 acetylase RimI-like enzyme